MNRKNFDILFSDHREPAWRSLGYVTREEMNAITALDRFGEITIDKRPMQVRLDGKISNDGKCVIVTGPSIEHPKETISGVSKVGDRIFTQREICGLFDEFVNQPVDTLGVLDRKSLKTFITWRLPSITVGEHDELAMYGWLDAGSEVGKETRLSIAAVRYVSQTSWIISDEIWKGKNNAPDFRYQLRRWLSNFQEEAENRLRS